MGAIVLALLCALASESLGYVYYIFSGVLSACIAVPFLFAFWKRTTLAGVMTAANYTEVLPGWMQNSYGYNYLAFGVLLSVISIVVVSLLTKPSSEKNLASVHASSVDNYETFAANAERWSHSPWPRVAPGHENHASKLKFFLRAVVILTMS